MTKNLKISIITLFVLSLCLSLFIYNISTLLFATITVIACSVLLSLSIDFLITFPLRDFTKKLKQSWNEKGVLPERNVLPNDLAKFAESFTEVLSDTQKKIAVMGEVRKFDQIKYEFIAIANHQIRTPITEISWAAMALGEIPEIDNDKKAHDLVLKIKEGIDHITTLTNQFLAVAELSMDKKLDVKSSLNLEKMIQNVVTRLDRHREIKGMEINIKKSGGIAPSVFGDERLFEFVFENIIMNAIAYGDQGTQIIIEIKGGSSEATVSVEDTGIGFKKDEIPMLFEKFFRGDKAKRLRPNGSGLALYLSKRILERYGGSISLNIPSAKKVKFIVALPMADTTKLAKFVSGY